MRASAAQHLQKASALTCLYSKKIIAFSFTCLFILFFSLAVFAQNTLRVKGRVTGENGQPVPKPSVLVKGTTTGVTGDENGDFEISVPGNGTLIISSVDFTTQEVKINGKTSITVTLVTLEKSLGEVVVVGYGTQRKKDVTGSIVSISGAALKEVPQSNLISQLQGRVAGIDIVKNNSRPGTSGQIRIRGNRTMTSNNTGNPGANAGTDDAFNAPLLILDGIPFGGNITDINPDDVASIDILKDASATAIYGSRGSNGVIIITTKRGRTGKAQISYNSYYGLSNTTGEYEMFNGTDYAKFKNDAKVYNNNVSNYPLIPSEVGGINLGTNTDWQDLIYKQGNVMDHELSVSGGNDATQVSLNGGYYKDNAVIPGQSFERYSVRSTIDQKVGNRIRIGINTLNTLSYTNGAGLNPLRTLTSLSPLVMPYNIIDGTINLLPIIGSGDGTTVNPLTITNKAAIVNRTRRLRTFNSLYGEVQIIKGLKYRINVGLDYRQDQGDDYRGPNTLYNNAGITPGTSLGTSIANGGMTVSNAEAWTYTIENVLTYDRTFAEKHRVTFTGLYSIQKDHGQNSQFSALGIPADYIQDYNLNLASGNLAAPAGNQGFSESGLISYMGRLNYSFDNRYVLTATLRRDGSSRLSPGNQWFTYPAIGAGWNISNEKFMSNMSFISNLKLRGGWGITASQGISPYQTLGTLSTNFYNYGTAQNIIGYFVTALANHKLKWQSTSNWNAGLDFGILKNRITGTIDVYGQKTKDILLNQNLPNSNGATTTIINLGKSKGHGVEISLSSINIQTRSGFTWSTDLNYFMNREEIVELNTPDLKADVNNGWFVGQPFTVIYDVKKIGIWQTKDATLAATFGQKPGQIRVQDLNNDGKIDANDRQIIGNFQPDWIGGITNRFAYKNFDLSVVIFARMGQTVVVPYLTSDGGAQGYDYFNNGRINSFKRNYWSPTNPTDGFPAPDAQTDGMTYGSTLGYRDGSFIKCRSINLGYNLPSSILKRTSISSLRVYVTANDPFIIYSPLVREGLALDPEGNGYSQNAGGQGSISSTAGGTPIPLRAITVGLNTPPTRQFLVGINLKF